MAPYHIKLGGLGMTAEMLEGIDVPEIFTTHLGALEDAGGGMMRVVRCVKRRGVLIPVVNLIVPAVNILQESGNFRHIAQQILHGEMATH